MAPFRLARKSNRKEEIENIQRAHADLSELEDLESKKTKLIAFSNLKK